MLEYAYKSHLVLCAVVIDRIPENTKSKNVSRLTQIQMFIVPLVLEMGKFFDRDS